MPIPPPNAVNSTVASPPPVASASLSPSGSNLTKTILVQQPLPTSPTATATTTNIVTSNTVHLPSTPVPKELLNINGQATQAQVVEPPFNPANVQLPQSVQLALQSINERVTKQQQRQKQIEEQQQIIKTEPIITLQGSPTGGSGGSGTGSSSSGGNGPLFYYLMPGSVPYSLSGDGGTTVQVKTSDGSIATAQLVTVPSGAIQSVIQQSSGSTTSTSSGSNSTSWILETSPSPSAVTRNSM